MYPSSIDYCVNRRRMFPLWQTMEILCVILFKLLIHYCWTRTKLHHKLWFNQSVKVKNPLYSLMCNKNINSIYFVTKSPKTRTWIRFRDQLPTCHPTPSGTSGELGCSDGSINHLLISRVFHKSGSLPVFSVHVRLFANYEGCPESFETVLISQKVSISRKQNWNQIKVNISWICMQNKKMYVLIWTEILVAKTTKVTRHGALQNACFFQDHLI